MTSTDEARDALGQAESLLRDLGDQIELCKVLRYRALLHHRRGDSASIESTLREVNEIASNLPPGSAMVLQEIVAMTRETVSAKT